MTRLAVQSLGSAQKGVCVMHSIYIYMKADKGVAEITFCYSCLHVKESCKACEESCKECKGSSKACEESCKACEESGKAPHENTSKPPFWKTIFLENDFCSFEKYST